MQTVSEMQPADSSGQPAKANQRISVVVINYGGLATVLDTIGSVLELQDVRPHVIVVDDGSTDGSPEAIERQFPEVQMHREPRNTKQVNRLRNIGLATARTDKVFVIDNDVTLDPDCLFELIGAMDADEAVAMCIPRLMRSWDSPIVYSGGARMHFVGATIDTRRDKSYDGSKEPYIAIGGGIALFDRRKIERVGGFDEGYELAWGDDGELHQRLLLAGYKTLYVPTAVCLHEHKPFDKARHYRAKGQLRNRWRYILTHYSLRTLLLVAPALIFYEIVQAVFFAAKGIPLLYVQGTLDAIRGLPTTLRRRRKVQALRSVPDRDILFAGELYVRPEHIGGLAARAIRATSGLLSLYWKLIRPALSARGECAVPRVPHPGAVVASEDAIEGSAK